MDQGKNDLEIEQRRKSVQSKLLKFNETEIEAFSIQLHEHIKYMTHSTARSTKIYMYFHLKIITMKHNICAHVLCVCVLYQDKVHAHNAI